MITIETTFDGRDTLSNYAWPSRPRRSGTRHCSRWPPRWRRSRPSRRCSCPTDRGPDEGAVEGLRVGIRAVLLGVAAGGRDGAAAGAGPVVGSERGIDSEADHIAPASVSEDVMDLVLNKVVAL